MSNPHGWHYWHSAEGEPYRARFDPDPAETFVETFRDRKWVPLHAPANALFRKLLSIGAITPGVLVPPPAAAAPPDEAPPAEERRFWMDCCIAMSHQRSAAEDHADRMLEEFRKRWRAP